MWSSSSSNTNSIRAWIVIRICLRALCSFTFTFFPSGKTHSPVPHTVRGADRHSTDSHEGAGVSGGSGLPEGTNTRKQDLMSLPAQLYRWWAAPFSAGSLSVRLPRDPFAGRTWLDGCPTPLGASVTPPLAGGVRSRRGEGRRSRRKLTSRRRPIVRIEQVGGSLATSAAPRTGPSCRARCARSLGGRGYRLLRSRCRCYSQTCQSTCKSVPSRNLHNALALWPGSTRCAAQYVGARARRRGSDSYSTRTSRELVCRPLLHLLRACVEQLQCRAQPQLV